MVNPEIRFWVEGNQLMMTTTNEIKWTCTHCGYSETIEKGEIVKFPLLIVDDTRDNVVMEVLT